MISVEGEYGFWIGSYQVIRMIATASCIHVDSKEMKRDINQFYLLVRQNHATHKSQFQKQKFA